MRIAKEQYCEGRRLLVVYGSSDETKPSDNICDGSIFIETDSTDVYIYNEKSSDWVEM